MVQWFLICLTSTNHKFYSSLPDSISLVKETQKFSERILRLRLALFYLASKHLEPTGRSIDESLAVFNDELIRNRLNEKIILGSDGYQSIEYEDDKACSRILQAVLKSARSLFLDKRS